MRIIGCDLHATQQAIAMLDSESGVVVELTLKHDDNTDRCRYLGYVCLVGRRRPDARLLDPVVMIQPMSEGKPAGSQSSISLPPGRAACASIRHTRAVLLELIDRARS
jgi:hypothetical protein